MSSFLEVPDQQHSSHISTHKDLNHTCILKSKENIFKPKCDKVLKKKLKKYRLRRDGKEDPDIIDVSKILISTLKIKSPRGQEVKINNCSTDSKDRLPKNYLFKMVRKKNECLKFATPNQNDVESKEDESMILLLPETEINESKQMNAFKLLMDSRNKSIGSNSPGKEKVIDENDELQNIKKKELKSKRNLFLQQMAKEKGYMKNQENEDYIDECIKRKLEKRATKLKEMITTSNSKKDIKLKTLKNNIIDNTQKTSSSVINVEGKKSVLKSGKLQLFNFLGDDDDEQSLTEVQDNNKVSPEDVEFLKKLSPSIRKKENMLSYFKKVTKDSDEQLNVDNEDENSIIKVKFAPKHKKKVKEIDSCKLELDVSKEAINTTLSNNNTCARKRKRNKTIPINSIQNNEKCKLEEINDEKGRPKRAAKKPIKYSDDMLPSSSDEELHIFTPKKKKSLDKSIHVKHKQKSMQELNSIEVKEAFKDNSSSGVKKYSDKRNNLKSKFPKNDNKFKEKCINLESNKSVKLAPIFSAKSKLTPLEQEARQNFLKSGVPDKLKIKQKDSNNVVPWNNFYTTLHIQQNQNTEVVTPSDATFKQKNVDWIAIVETVTNKIIECDEAHLFEKLLTPCDEKNYKLPLKHKPELLLKCIKKQYLKFPVYRTFHLLKAKNYTEIKDCSFSELDNSIEIVNNISDIPDCPDKLTWNDKYKPMSSKQIIGNFESVRELKRWLESWSEDLIKNKSGIIGDSDLSDFCFSDSDIDSRDAFKNKNNVLIISGQTGTGKTSCVYAVAAELAIKVIEVNASSKRTGKIMLQDLQEATQSHKVNRGNNNKKEGSQSSQEIYTTSKIVKKHGRPKKTYERKKCVDAVKIDVSSQQSQTSSQESTRTEMSLILIDDADIVFDQDDGFGSAVSQLINYSKRPVILITSSLTCPHLQKYISFGKIIKMNPLIPRMLGTWLDIMCLADTNSCYPGFGCKLLDYYKGDIRKTINFLQFYMISNKHLNQIEDSYQDTDMYKANIDDENSSMSWADQDVADNHFTKEIVDDIEIKMVLERQLRIMGDSLNLFDVWWNIGNEFSSIGQIQSNNTSCTTDITIEDASRILDTMSFIDCLDSNMHDAHNITSKPWLSVEVPSVMEKENMDCYNIMNMINKDISKELLTGSVSLLKGWREKPKCPPSISTQRRRNKIVFQHNTLSKYLNPSSSLDRRAIALDYWSSCRTICRLEKDKTDNNMKRNNRFCHYLKSANILCKNDYFDCLSESLT